MCSKYDNANECGVLQQLVEPYRVSNGDYCCYLLTILKTKQAIPSNF